MSGLKNALPWESPREVAFECEPGTLSEHKLEAIRDFGVNRLSLGVENFDDDILVANNRAHRSMEIYRAWEWLEKVDFAQVNLDLIAGMVGETEANWQRNIDETIRLAPEAVTIYQMEIPYNTTIYKEMKEQGADAAPVADWATKRRWVGEAFGQLEKNGYHVSSAYTAVKDTSTIRFIYRGPNCGMAPTCWPWVYRRSVTWVAFTIRTKLTWHPTWQPSTAVDCQSRGHYRSLPKKP